MPTVIPVKFSYVVRELWFDPAQTEAQEGDHVICQTERGTEIGLATADAKEVSSSELQSMIGSAQLKRVLRIADDDDLDRAEDLADLGEDAMPTFRRLVSASGLDMKPVGVQYLFDGDKAVCYFAAEERVDFRQLVRDLSRELHVRIDMRQIGVREEAAIVGGYGHCGQELCCRRFNTGFDPVSIRMAKEQDLPLNSTKISGACGRLMCCLRYEFEAYRDFKQRAPKRNAVIETPLGKGKIVEYNTPKEQIALRLESGKTVRIALADMTTSEAAHKKSEELGCPCRPDTVSRSVLERLESPDVQMALAELDRKMGVLAEPAVDASDIFVEPKRKRRRPSDGDPRAAERGEKPAKQRQGSAAAGGAASAPAEGQGSRRRKRRTDAPEAAAPADQQQATRRRRHHQATEAPEGAAAQQAAPAEQRQGAKRTRRPGDKGGGMQPSRAKQRAMREREREQQAQQQAGGRGKGRGGQGQGGRPGDKPAQGAQPGADGADGAPKPRRRRHRSRGGNAGEGGAPAAE